MATKPSLIKVGRQGIPVRGSRIPASFFRHQQPGKRFVVLANVERRLMHVRVSDLDAIQRAYGEYAISKGGSPARPAKLSSRSKSGGGL